MTSYTDATTIAMHLGTTWTTDAQVVAADAAAAAVTQWIDDYKGQSWQSAEILSEYHRTPLPGPGWQDGGTLYLKTRPVVSVEEVRRRPLLVGSTPVVLDATDWELLDGASGVLLVKAQWDDLLCVDYTVSARPPANIGLAATLLAARYLAPLTQPGSHGLESVSVGQGELSVRFAQHVATAGIPPEVLTLLGPRKPVLA